MSSHIRPGKNIKNDIDLDAIKTISLEWHHWGFNYIYILVHCFTNIIQISHKDIERYQELFHENDYFYESPETYDGNLKIESYPEDWSTSHGQENFRRDSMSKGKEMSNKFGTSWKFQTGKDEYYYKPSIEVAPMTI